jgi:hypothetical protein
LFDNPRSRLLLKNETAHDYSTAGIVHRCGINLPDATEHGLPVCAGKQACSLFSKYCGTPKARRAHRLKAYVLPPTAIDVLLEQRHDIHAYRTSGSGPTYWAARFAVAALTKSRLNATDRATLLSSP